MSSGRTIHFLLHVPKCAGTTVEDHFARHLGPRFMLAPRWESVWRNFVGNRYPDLDAGKVADVVAVSGHSLSVSMMRSFLSADIRCSVLLRDPLGYLLSFYNYRWTRFEQGYGPRPPEFAAWYAAQRRNPISRFLLNRFFEWGVPAIYGLSSTARLSWLETRLADFHFVGSYRRAGEMIAGVSRELGVPEAVEDRNVTRSPKLAPQEIPDALRARIVRDNALDAALFERWKERGWKGAPSDPAPALSSFDQPRYVVGDISSVIARKLS